MISQLNRQFQDSPRRKGLQRSRSERAETSSSSHDFVSSFASSFSSSSFVCRNLLAIVFLSFFFLPSVVLQTNAEKGRSCDSENAIDNWKMPFVQLGNKKYYVGHFYKANWYKSHQYCRFHGMNLASIESKEENSVIEKYISEIGMGNEHFWTSGTDQGEEGTFFWMGNGRPITFTNWNAGEPNNFKYENGEEEHCLELWNRDGKGLKWNDTPCSFETFFICEH